MTIVMSAKGPAPNLPSGRGCRPVALRRHLRRRGRNQALPAPRPTPAAEWRGRPRVLENKRLPERGREAGRRLDLWEYGFGDEFNVRLAGEMLIHRPNCRAVEPCRGEDDAVRQRNIPAMPKNRRGSYPLLVISFHIGIHALEKTTHLFERTQRDDRDTAVKRKYGQFLSRLKIQALPDIGREFDMKIRRDGDGAHGYFHPINPLIEYISFVQQSQHYPVSRVL